MLILALAGVTNCRTRQHQTAGGGDVIPDVPVAVSNVGPPAAGELESTRVRVRLMRGPRLRFDAEVFDFGLVEAGEVVERLFPFTNEGDATLVLQGVLSQCGCAGAQAVGGEVPPGGKGAVRVSLRTGGLQGPVTKVFLVDSNDPERNRARIALEGRVVSEVLVEPRFLNWGNLARSEPAPPIRFTVELRQGNGLRIEQVRSESDSVEITPEREDGSGGVYRVALRRKLTTGRFTGTITIRTSSLQVPEIRVPFYALIEGDVRAIPPILSFDDLVPGKVSVRQFALKSRGPGEFRVKGVRASTDRIRGEVRTVAPGRHYEVVVTCEPGENLRNALAERLTVTLEGAAEDVLEVPVCGSARGEAPEPLSHGDRPAPAS